MKKNYKTTALITTASLLMIFASSCSPGLKNDLQNYWMKETGYMPPEKASPGFDSNRTRDFIHSDGTGTAVPAKAGYDLYISPFAPTRGYIRSKLPAGSKVRCPYSKKLLILGDRDQIAEKTLP